MKYWLKDAVAVVVCTLVMGFLWDKYRSGTTDQSSTESFEKIKLMETKGVKNFRFLDINGENFQLHHLTGKVTIVNFWATWCSPCVEEYPSLLRLVKHMNGKLKLIAITVDEDRQEVDDFLKIFGRGKYNDIFLVQDATRKYANYFGTDRLPETYILDSKFKLIRKIPNSEKWDSPQVMGFFKSLIDKP